MEERKKGRQANPKTECEHACGTLCARHLFCAVCSADSLVWGKSTVMSRRVCENKKEGRKTDGTLLAIAAIKKALHDARLSDAFLAEENDLEVNL